MERVLDIEATGRAGSLVFKGVEDLNTGWDDEQVRCALVSFMWATDAILAECADWKASRFVGDDQGGVDDGRP
jgi:hypothetical protein